jgi:hypothetical protein
MCAGCIPSTYKHVHLSLLHMERLVVLVLPCDAATAGSFDCKLCGAHCIVLCIVEQRSKLVGTAAADPKNNSAELATASSAHQSMDCISALYHALGYAYGHPGRLVYVACR